MRLSDIKRNPGRKDLLVFGLSLPAIFAVIGYLVRSKLGAPGASQTIWIVGAAVTLLFAVIPPLRRPLYLGWMYAVFPIGWTVSHLILGILFYGVITPSALVMRLIGRDPMKRRFDRQAQTYWISRPPPPPVERYFRQY